MQRTALTLFSTDPLRPTEAVFGQRQRANSIAGGSKNGVANGGQDRRKSRLAQPRGRVVRLQKMHFNFRRDLRHAHRRGTRGGWLGGGAPGGWFFVRQLMAPFP